MVSDDILADLCDKNGFLIQTEEWSDDIARAFAAQEGIALTDAQSRTGELYKTAVRKRHRQQPLSDGAVPGLSRARW